MREIYVLTGYDDFIGQTRKPWVSIDTDAFIKELQSLGFEVRKHDFHEVVNGAVEIRDSLVYYSFSHRENLRPYIRDCLLYLQRKGNTLLPSFDLFYCHENKGWQELLKRDMGIHSLDYHFFSSKREMQHYDLKFHLVFKTLTGSNSTGVALVNSKDDILKELTKHEPRVSWGQKLDYWRRKNLRKHKSIPGYPNYDLYKDALQYQDYMTPEIPFILQEYVPGLSFDYRVIVLGDKYFISKRHTKAGDFRASGAKLFDFNIENPRPELDMAHSLYKRFKAPCLSVDLGEDASGNIYLFEYQAQHFGINIIVRGKGYYVLDNGEWRFREKHESFEEMLAAALGQFLNA